MNWKTLGCLLTVAAVATATAEDSIDNLDEIKLKGCLGERLDAMIARHVGGTDVDYLTGCFREQTERHGGWQTEFWGKYMHSAVPYAIYSGSESCNE